MEQKHFQFKHPFTCLVSGPTGSGKTILIRRILKHHDLLIHNLKSPIKVLWAYGQWQPLLNVPISDNVIVHYIDNLPTVEQIKDYNPDVIVIDDLMNELNKDKNLENLFIKKSHHMNKSVIFVVQNLFYNSPLMRTLSLNSHYIMLMKNPRDSSQIMNLARQIYPSNTKFLVEAYNDATREAYGYIKVDLTPDTPESLRLQTRITPEEVLHLNKRFAPIIFKPKKNVS
jgi:nucleoside-triphosphatase THEP1